MPTSTAATVTSASSPAARPPILIGTVSGWRGRVFSGASIATSSLCAPSSIAEPGEAQRAAGHALGLDVERAMGQRDRVGARAPVGADLERHDIVALGEIDVDELARACRRPGRSSPCPAKCEAMRSLASSPGA